MYKEKLAKCVDVMGNYNHHISRDIIMRSMFHDGIIAEDDLKYNQEADEAMEAFGYNGFVNNVERLYQIDHNSDNTDAIAMAPSYYYYKYPKGVLRDSTLRDATMYEAGENGYWMWNDKTAKAFSTVEKNMLVPIDFSNVLCAYATFNLNLPEDLKLICFQMYRVKLYRQIRDHMCTSTMWRVHSVITPPNLTTRY